MKYWTQKVVVVTGGSAGLGLEIGRQFAEQGATVVLVARNEERLAAACQQHSGLNSVAADVASDLSVTQAVDSILANWGRIDVWINNVGKSARVDLKTCPVEHYRELMELNFYSAVRCSLAAMDALEQHAGLLINIGSLAAKTGWFHVAPYATSKHALAAFSHQWRLEGPAGVDCLLVCPGPIRREDAGQRYAAESATLEASAKQPGAGVKLKGIPPALLARRIERAARRRRRQLVVPAYTAWLFALQQVWPALGDWIIKKFSGSRSKS